VEDTEVHSQWTWWSES